MFTDFINVILAILPAMGLSFSKFKKTPNYAYMYFYLITYMVTYNLSAVTLLISLVLYLVRIFQ